MESALLQTIVADKLIEHGDSVLVAVSGGIDSTALFHVLIDIREMLNYRIGVVHINHLLRGNESDRDQEFVVDLCQSHNIPCYSRRIDVRAYAKCSGLSLQHAGRDVRYDYFSRVAEKEGYNKIALGHTADDQVETFLLRVIKGTGISGLSAIPMKRERIIRPFLGTWRKDIEVYVKSRSMAYVEDSSNIKTIYERNYLRHKVVPVMEGLNSAVKEKILALQKDLTDVNRQYDERAAVLFREATTESGNDFYLDVSRYLSLDSETKHRMIACILGKFQPGLIPLREHMVLIEKTVRSGRPNATAILPCGIRVKKEYERMIITTKGPPEGFSSVFPVGPGKNTIKNLAVTLDIAIGSAGEGLFTAGPDTAFLDADKIGELTVRTFRNGDRFIPLGMSLPVKLKDFFISRKVPREKRRLIPLLVSGKDIVWVVGHRIDERYKVTEKTKSFIKIHSC